MEIRRMWENGPKRENKPNGKYVCDKCHQLAEGVTCIRLKWVCDDCRPLMPRKAKGMARVIRDSGTPRRGTTTRLRGRLRDRHNGKTNKGRFNMSYAAKKTDTDFKGQHLCDACWNGRHYFRDDLGRKMANCGLVDADGKKCECHCVSLLAEKHPRKKLDKSAQAQIDTGNDVITV